MPFDDYLPAAVPTVGLPMRVGEPTVVVPVICRCRADNAPMLIRTVDQAAMCLHCKQTYAIVSVQYAFGKGSLAVGVQQILIAPGQPPRLADS